jgi:endonuclease/exonuclease/phosphatase (EEP) superfamily protein YafD
VKLNALASKLVAISAVTLILVGCVTSVFSVLGFFGAQCTVLELFSHFRWQYAITLGILSVILLKHKRFVWLFAVSAAYNLCLVGMLYLPIKQDSLSTASKASHEFKLLDMNIYFHNKNPELINAEINRASADVVVIEELTAPLYNALQPGLRDYPYRVFNLREDPFGIGIFSKTKLISRSDNPLKSSVPLAVSAVIQPGEKPIEIIGVHLLPPMSIAYCDFNKGIVDLLAKEAHDFAGPKLIVGDLNATPWSALFLRLAQKSGLRDSEAGFGLQPSWPCDEPVLQIPIDHCLVSYDCKVLQRSLGEETGSDHKPLLLRVLAP